jgi:hypothetical protein
VDAAAEYLPELAGGVCVLDYWDRVFGVDDGYGQSGQFKSVFGVGEDEWMVWFFHVYIELFSLGRGFEQAFYDDGYGGGVLGAWSRKGVYEMIPETCMAYVYGMQGRTESITYKVSQRLQSFNHTKY